MLDLKIIDDIKEIHNLGRIRSKKLLNLIDLLSWGLKKKSIICFSYTINIAYYNETKKDLEEVWLNDLKEVTGKLDHLIEADEENQFTVYSIEMHRSKRFLNKNNNVIDVLKKENNLRGYPHIHVFSVYSFNDLEEGVIKALDIKKNILNYFINYDIKINDINKKGSHIKNSIKYVLKEYKFKDLLENLEKTGIPSEKRSNIIIYFNKEWVELECVLKKFNSIRYTKFILVAKNKTLLLGDAIKDPLYKLKVLFENSLKKDRVRLYKSNIYGPTFFESRALVFYRTVDSYLTKMALEDLSNSSLILSNKKQFCTLVKESCNNVCGSNVFEDVSAYFNSFNYVEYKDFYLNLHRVAVENKGCKEKYRDWNNIIPFKFYNYSKNDLLELQSGVSTLRSIFDNESEFFSYLVFIGKVLSQTCRNQKIKTLYLYGPSNSGKTLLTEKFLREIFGDENIGILNTTDSKFLLDQVCDKHVIILNEFKYNINNRELLLKLLDGSLIPINRKYRESIKLSLDSFTLATSNYSPKDQMMDKAFYNRLLPLKTTNSINSEDYKQVIKSLPLIVLYCLFSLLVTDYNHLEAYIYNQLEDSSKIITVV